MRSEERSRRHLKRFIALAAFEALAGRIPRRERRTENGHESLPATRKHLQAVARKQRGSQRFPARPLKESRAKCRPYLHAIPAKETHIRSPSNLNRLRPPLSRGPRNFKQRSKPHRQCRLPPMRRPVNSTLNCCRQHDLPNGTEQGETHMVHLNHLLQSKPIRLRLFSSSQVTGSIEEPFSLVKRLRTNWLLGVPRMKRRRIDFGHAEVRQLRGRQVGNPRAS